MTRRHPWEGRDVAGMTTDSLRAAVLYLDEMNAALVEIIRVLAEEFPEIRETLRVVANDPNLQAHFEARSEASSQE